MASFTEIVNGDKPVLMTFMQIGAALVKCYRPLFKKLQKNLTVR